MVDGDPAITIGKYNWTGGPDAPAFAGYFNIFVASGTGGLGIAAAPGQANGDGVQVDAIAFGGPGLSCSSGSPLNTNTTYNLGRTLTHEAGHYFDLFHTFQGGCSDGDTGTFSGQVGVINDTPATSNPFFGCPVIPNPGTCADVPASGCASMHAQITNYMDYTDDACMIMFTMDQAAVMNGWANSLPFVDNATACGATANNSIASCIVDCMDGVQNGAETGIDCGGPDCPPCAVEPACSADMVEIINAPFDDCAIPAGWSVVALNGGTTAFVTFNNMSVPGGGATPPSDFMGCIALIDDDAPGSADPPDVRCILTNVIDMSAFANGTLTFDWHNESVVNDGNFIVEVYDGTGWVQVFFTEGDGSANDETVDLSAYTNTDFQIRFCYDDEGGWQWGVGIDNVSVCAESGTPMCPADITTDDISGSYCDGSDATISATPASSNVTFAWSSSNPNVAIVDAAAASTSIEMSALTQCQIETADITLVATCNLDGSEIFNGVVSTVMVYPAPPADVTTLVVLNENTCDEPVLVDPNCAAFVTLTADAGNPTFPVAAGESGTASYTISYASPAGAPECCVVPVSGELIIGGAGATGNDDGDLEIIGTGGASGWTSTSTNFGSVMCDAGSCGTGAGSINYGVAPNSNAWLAWFGGAGVNVETGTLETDVIISACDGGTATMTFAYENSVCGDAADFIELQIDGTVVWSDDADPATCGTLGVVQLISVDLSAFADGGSHNILFTSTSGAAATSSNFTVDNIMLETTGCGAGGSPCEGAISGDYDCVAVLDPSIPTMGEWGLMILGLLILICSIVAIREKNHAPSMS